MLRCTHSVLLVVVSVMLAACTTSGEQFASYGGMREVMRLGQTEPRAPLQQFAVRGTYGLGALAGLEGEILIEDGEVWVARSVAEVEPATAADQATLLAIARVAAWREVQLQVDTDLAALEEALAAAVPAAADSKAAPLPFLVEGMATQLTMHVVRGYCPHGESVADAQPPDVWTSTANTPTELRLVGVFAPGRAGTLTHHGTAVHLHALLPGSKRPRAMGHVDKLTLAAGSVLRVPSAR